MKSEDYIFLKAESEDIDEIWSILQQAIERRRKDGSNQWQDGYPNISVLKNDIEKRYGFVLKNSENIVGYCAIIFNDEPAYDHLEGNWLSYGEFAAVHRVAVSDKFLGKGLAKLIFKNIEDIVLQNRIKSIKVDTNFDNHSMLHILEKLGYVYCGEVYFRGSPRKAFEKVLCEVKL